MLSGKLSSLSADLVGAIALWLHSEDVKRLLETGSAALRARIAQGVTHIDHEICSLEFFPRWAYHLRHLRSFRVYSPTNHSCPVNPLSLDFLPAEPRPSLESIEFTFLPAMHLLRTSPDGRTLSQMCPNLTSLTLATSSGLSSDWLRNFESLVSQSELQQGLFRVLGRS